MNWLIKLLGGYTAEEYGRAMHGVDRYKLQIATLQSQLHQAQKNDHRDDKGRYTKEGE